MSSTQIPLDSLAPASRAGVQTVVDHLIADVRDDSRVFNMLKDWDDLWRNQPDSSNIPVLRICPECCALMEFNMGSCTSMCRCRTIFCRVCLSYTSHKHQRYVPGPMCPEGTTSCGTAMPMNCPNQEYECPKQIFFVPEEVLQAALKTKEE